MTTVVFDRVTAAVDGTMVINDASFEVDDGEFVGVIGRSGSGKTSLIRTIAGFTDVVEGRLLLDGRNMARVAVSDRDLGMVFQQPVVFPMRSVRRNVSFPLELRQQDTEEIRQRVDAEVRSMHLEHLLARPSKTLSRGEAQLVQIARTMVRAPSVLLLDEPLAGLDAVLQRSMRSELSMLQEGYGVTTVMATNDPLDALVMPNRLLVLDHGSVVQSGAPLDVRTSPATVDAALATGECSLVPAIVEGDADGYWLAVADDAGRTAFRYRAWTASLAGRIGQQVTLGIRPDDVRADTGGDVPAIVRHVGVGSMGVARMEIGGHRITVQRTAGLRADETVRLRIDRMAVFDADNGRAIT